jgi:hypothetical protein
VLQEILLRTLARGFKLAAASAAYELLAIALLVLSLVKAARRALLSAEGY